MRHSARSIFWSTTPDVDGDAFVRGHEQELFDKVLALNLKGPYRLSALIGTRMAAGGGGSIINVSSVGSLMPRAAFGPYAGAKAALNAALYLASGHSSYTTVAMIRVDGGRRD